MVDWTQERAAADVDRAVGAAVAALTGTLDRDWRVPAGDLEWDCWETIEHISDDLFVYAGQLAPKRPPQNTHVPFGWYRKRPGGPPGVIFGDPGAGPAGLLEVLEASGAFLVALVRTAPPGIRAHHVFGLSDAVGFAAMGIVETLVHMHDVALGLGIGWEPPADLCDRVLTRLFPDAPADPPRWPTLLWATGRIELPDRPRRVGWRWDGTVRDGEANG